MLLENSVVTFRNLNETDRITVETRILAYATRGNVFR